MKDICEVLWSECFTHLQRVLVRENIHHALWLYNNIPEMLSFALFELYFWSFFYFFIFIHYKAVKICTQCETAFLQYFFKSSVS